MVSMRIKKTINGDSYYFYVQFAPKECKAKVKYFCSDEWVICELSNDFNHIILPKGKFFLNGKDAVKLKLNKQQKLDVLDYNPQSLK